MTIISSKETILNRIRAAKEARNSDISPIPNSELPVFKEIQPSQIECFKKELETVSGKCIICNSENELLDQLAAYLQELTIDIVFCTDKNIIDLLNKKRIKHTQNTAHFTDMQAAVTDCEFLVARTGSVVISSAGKSGRQLNIFPPVHIVMARKNQLVNYPEDALQAVKEKYGTDLPSMISFISGPSRTADIEKTLVLGAHGPKSLFVLIY